MHSKRIGALAIASLVASTLVVPQATAAVDGTNVVISEAYGGGNNGATLTNDFVELYNPTDAPIDLTGTIPAKGSGGTQALPTPDVTSTLAMGGSNGTIKLADAAGPQVDLVGYGTATVVEGAAAPAARGIGCGYR